MDFNNKREVKTKKLLVTIEFSFEESPYEIEEITERLQRELDISHAKPVSEFIVFLLRSCSASSWELQNLEVEEIA